MLESFPLDRYYSEKLFQMIGGIPIIGDIINQGPAKLKQILRYCHFLKYLPREEIIGINRYCPWIFFVLDGECLVMDDERKIPQESILPGQVFGELDAVLDSTGRKTVVADPKCQEVLLLGLNSLIFSAQTKIRVLDEKTRIMVFKTIYQALLKRFKEMQGILEATGTEQRDAAYEALAFVGKRNGTDHLVFYDIETKKLALAIAEMSSRLLDIMNNTDQSLPSISVFLNQKKYDFTPIRGFIRDLPFRLRSTREIDDGLDSRALESDVEQVKTKSVYSLHELSFLVVDDDEQYRNSAVKILKDLGATKVHVEKNGLAAWNYICSHSTTVDVVLCDWIMPEMTGLELYTAIEQSSAHLKGIVFIMLTSVESKTSVLEAVESGVHGYVIKPLSQKHILKQIQQALKQVRGAILKM